MPDHEHQFVSVVLTAHRTTKGGFPYFDSFTESAEIAYTFCTKCGETGPSFAVNAELPKGKN